MLDKNHIQEAKKILSTLKNSGWKLSKDPDINGVAASQGVICMNFAKGPLVLSIQCGEDDCFSEEAEAIEKAD
jgi:hypothetical protein